jgi:hypothetical protein
MLSSPSYEPTINRPADVEMHSYASCDYGVEWSSGEELDTLAPLFDDLTIA